MHFWDDFMLKTKSIHTTLDESDGLRVLVTRFWPRGVKRSHFDVWHRNLSPSAILLKQYKNQEVDWNEFVYRFKSELRTDENIQTVKELQSKAIMSNVTLLCYEPDGAFCHRHILREIVMDIKNLDLPFEPEYTDNHKCIPVQVHVTHHK